MNVNTKVATANPIPSKYRSSGLYSVTAKENEVKNMIITLKSLQALILSISGPKFKLKKMR